jgi:hypothetical protein
MLCLFALKIVGNLRSRSGGSILNELSTGMLEDKQNQWQKSDVEEGRTEGIEGPAIIVPPLWYLSRLILCRNRSDRRSLIRSDPSALARSGRLNRRAS